MKCLIPILLFWSHTAWLSADVVPGAARTYIAGLTPDGDDDNRWEEQGGGTDFEWTFVNGDQIVFDANDPLIRNLDAAYNFPDAAAIGPAGSLLGPVDEATFEIWFKPESLSGRHIIFEVGGSGNGTTLLQDGNLLYFISQAGAANRMQTVLLLPASSTNRFNQVVGILDFTATGAEMRLHLNAGGAVIDQIGPAFNNWSGTNGSGLGRANSAFAGNDVFTGVTDFRGKIGVFRQYSGGVLTPSEIRQNYDALALIPPTILSFDASPGSTPAGQAVTLSWSIIEADTLSIVPGLASSSALQGSILVHPTETTIYQLNTAGVGGSSVAYAQVVVDGLLFDPTLNEFMADNNRVLFDGEGNASDWIEVYNPNVIPLDISGWYLSDDALNLVKWRFPAGTILSGREYRILFASGQDEGAFVDVLGTLHTTFRLDADGEFIALVKPDGFTVTDAYSPEYPEQQEDISYGRGSNGGKGYLATATPGAENTEAFLGFVADTKFSVDRGFYTSAFQVAITTKTDGGEIRYTLDGSEPTDTNGLLYTNEIPIQTTTSLRAAAFKTDFRSSNVDTQTYLFLQDVVQQSDAPSGFPTTWGTHTQNGNVLPTIADYEMDPTVVTNPVYAAEMMPALTQIPTVSLTMSLSDWFNESAEAGVGGIYANAQKRGDDWEREVSMEFMYPHQTNRNFQVNAGVRILGNITRNAFHTRKHTLRVAFRAQYGTGRLKEPIFEGSDVANFNKLVFRGHHGNSWMNQNGTQRTRAQYIRDEWMHHAQRDMGWASIYGEYVHLYINGLYWGLYNMVERPDADFAASHFGGDPIDYDALNSGEALDGDAVAYNEMMALANAGINDEAAYQEMQRYTNITNLTDYMILVMGCGERDWDGHNWYAGKHRETGRFHWFCWDMEHVFEGINDDFTGKNTANRPTRVFTRLRAYPEYRLHFADRMRKHFFNGGVMTTEYYTNSWAAQVAEIDQAIIAESARWGDWRRPGNPYTRDNEWMAEINRLYNIIMPARPAVAFQQFVDLGLYPDVPAPDFSQWGGLVPAGYPLRLSAPTGTVYYTLDGSDPRAYLSGNALGQAYTSSIPLQVSTQVKARTLDGATWSALTEGVFTLQSLSPLRVVELMYHPASPASTNYVESDYEYIELMNTGTNEIGLAGIHFTGGIDFDFTRRAIQTLQAGERVLVVKHQAAFVDRYGSSTRIAGEFVKRYNFETRVLDNSGESIELRDGAGRIIQAFDFRDGWFDETDGDGFSLVVRDPQAGTNTWNDAMQWSASLFANGTPGEGPLDGDFDRLPDAWELAELGGLGFDAVSDKDGDGFRERGEWIAGTDPNNPASKLSLLIPELDASTMVLRWPSVSNRVYAIWQFNRLWEAPLMLTNGLLATPPMNVHTVQVDQVNAGYLRVSVEQQ